MRKTVISVGTSLLMCLITAMPALADSSLPEPQGGPDVLGVGGTQGGSGGTAFTGANISWTMMALVVLVIVAAVSLAMLRRRGAAD